MGEILKYGVDKAEGYFVEKLLELYLKERVSIPLLSEISAILDSKYKYYLPGAATKYEIDGKVFTGYSRDILRTWQYPDHQLKVPSCKIMNKVYSYYQSIGSPFWAEISPWRQK